jgi:hypothetical protein
MFKYDAWITAMLIIITVVLKVSSIVALYFTYDSATTIYQYKEPIEMRVEVLSKIK